MKKTIDHIKQKRTVPGELKKSRKEDVRIKKLITKALKSEPRTIPRIAKETGLPAGVVTYHLMTLRKYGEIEVDRIDDMDEYFFYKLKAEK